MDALIPSRNGIRERASTVIAILGILAIVLLLNAPYRYDWVHIDGVLLYSNATNENTHKTRLIHDQPPAIQAGWPLKYWRSRAFPNGLTQRVWSWRNLAINLGLSTLASLLVTWSVMKRFSQSSTNAKSKLSLQDLLIVILLLAIPLGYFSKQRSQSGKEEELAGQLRREGRCIREAEVPHILVEYIPQPLLMAWARITQVQLVNPIAERVKQVTELPNLRLLRIGGGDYDLRYLDTLPSQFHLSDLHITGRALDGKAVQCIAHCAGVRDLSLARTNIGPAGIHLLGQLRQLQTLFLDGCPVPLSQFGNPEFRETIEELVLPRPNAGYDDSLTISDWPKLTRLHVVGLDQYVNTTGVSLSIDKMPMLRTIELDEFQKFDLNLSNLPALEFIRRRVYQREQRISGNSTIPGELWLEGITLENVPLITKLNLYGSDLRRLDFKSQALENLGIACYRINSNGFAIYDQEVPLEIRQGWIDQLGKNTLSPVELDLSALNFTDVDLTPLASCNGTKSLLLADTALKVEQLAPLSDMEQLQTLNVQTNRLSHQDINAVITKFPQLKKLIVDSGMVTRLRIENHSALQRLALEQYAFPTIEALRLVNLTDFQSALTVGPYCMYAAVESVPKLSGLGFVGPLPKNTQIKGTGSLEWFVAGGPHLSADIVREVLTNTPLRHITFAYPSVEKVDLQPIGQLTNLTAIHLPGCPVDDDLFLNWNNLANLQELDLSDTSVTNRVVPQIVGFSQLDTLSLANSPLTSSDAQQLMTLTNLQHVDLSGVNLQQDAFAAIIDLPNLQRLILKDAKVDLTPLGSLQQSQFYSLRFFDLSNSTVDWNLVRLLAELRPDVRFRLSPVTAPADLLVQLQNSNQLDIKEDGWGWEVTESSAQHTQFEPPTLDLSVIRGERDSALP